MTQCRVMNSLDRASGNAVRIVLVRAQGTSEALPENSHPVAVVVPIGHFGDERKAAGDIELARGGVSRKRRGLGDEISRVQIARHIFGRVLKPAAQTAAASVGVDCYPVELAAAMGAGNRS